MTQARLSNGVSLACEVHGDPADPVIFVILGITDNITDWPPGLHEPLVEAGYCVVRHELRDSGLSTKFEHAGRPDLATAQEALARGDLPTAAYTIHDVAEDAKLLLEYLDVRAACVVGYSFGAAVAQLLALKAPGTVDGLVCLHRAATTTRRCRDACLALNGQCSRRPSTIRPGKSRSRRW